MNQPNVKSVDPHWKGLYKIGGAAGVIAAALAVIEIIIEISGSSLTSAPTTVIGWFTLLQDNRLLGVALLGIFEVVFFPLSVLMFFALYPALRRISCSLAASAFILNLIATVAYLSTNATFSMVSLSDQYVVATSEGQRSMLLAAGQAMLATSQGTGANLSFVLGSIAGLVVSLVMLRSRTFGKPTAIVGIVGNALGLPGAALGPMLWAINGLLMLVWLVMVGIRLLQISQHRPKMEATIN